MAATSVLIATVVAACLRISMQNTTGETEHDIQFYFIEVANRMPQNAGRRSVRQEDPSFIVAHLFQGDIVSIDICVEERSKFRLDNITHSNDGQPDTVRVSLSGQIMTSFRTANHSNWGELWNSFNGTGPLGDYVDLDVGRHTLTLTITESDCYGMEIGTIYASIKGMSGAKVRWCGSTFVFADIQEECSKVIPYQPIKTPAPIQSTTTVAQPLVVGLLPSTIYTTQSTTTTTTSTVTTQATTSTSTLPPTTTMPSTEVQLTSPTTNTPPTTVALQYEDVFVSQNSYNTECIDTRNVNIVFSVPSLTGVRVISKLDNSNISHKMADHDKALRVKTCKTNVWQLGDIDGRNSEFSPTVPDADLLFALNYSKGNTASFPGSIDPRLTKKLEIRFHIPSDKVLKRGSMYFALALINITDNVNVGLQYTTGNGDLSSDIHDVTFTSKYRVLGWNLNSMVKTQQEIKSFILHFSSESKIIHFDFMRFDVHEIDVRKKNVVLSSGKTIRIRGLHSKGSGMTVDVDSNRKGEYIEKVQILYRQGLWEKFHNILSVLSDGRMFPYHKDLIKDSDLSHTMEGKVVDVSGFVVSSDNIEPKNNLVKHVDIVTQKQRVTLTFEDGSRLSFHLIPTDTETQLFILDFSIPKSPAFSEQALLRRENITFTSTHVNENLAAVNKLVVDGVVELPIMADLSVYSGRHSYTFRKTSQTRLFHASTTLEIVF